MKCLASKPDDSYQIPGTLVEFGHQKSKAVHHVTSSSSCSTTLVKSRTQGDEKVNKTTSKRASDKINSCPFWICIFCDKSSGFWFLQDTLSFIHCNHIKIQPQHLPVKKYSITDEIKHDIVLCSSSYVPSSFITKMIHQKYDINISSQQIESIKKESLEELLQAAGVSPSGTNAEKLINYFDSLQDVSFLYVLHDIDSGFVTYSKQKGRKPKSSAESSVISSHELNLWRENLCVNDKYGKKILVSLAWSHDSEVREFSLFPEFLATDITFNLNRDQRNISYFVTVDSSNRVRTVMACIMPSKKTEAYSWVFNEACPFLLGQQNLDCVHCLAMDNEYALNTAYLSSQVWKRCRLRLDMFHIFLKPFFDAGGIYSNEHLQVMFKWFFSFFVDIENDTEYRYSLSRLAQFMKESRVKMGEHWYNIANQILTTITCNERYLFHHRFITCCDFGFLGDSICESYNSVVKRHVNANSSLTNSTDIQLALVKDRQHKAMM